MAAVILLKLQNMGGKSGILLGKNNYISQRKKRWLGTAVVAVLPPVAFPT
jgi:hypothetical protein